MFAIFAVVTLVKSGNRNVYYPLRLIYEVPEHLQNLESGQLCLVEVRSPQQGLQKCVGMLLDFCEKPNFPCSPVHGTVPYTKLISKKLFSLLEWVSSYYLYSFEKIVSLIAPASIWHVSQHEACFKRITQFIGYEENQYYCKDNPRKSKIKGEIILPARTFIALTDEQNSIYEGILAEEKGACLLHGVTGSGKTEVYLKLAQAVIQKGKKVLILVPEIALTPQMSARFRALFQDKLAILHSGLSKGEYEREWFKVHLGLADIVLGVRTSVFAPLSDIGLIIVDEEHDLSYKSHDFPIYHARDVAVVRAQIESAICVLGSATPSVESIFNVKNKKYRYLNLQSKFSGNTVSSVIINAKDSFLLQDNSKNNFITRSTQIEFKDESIAPEICAYLQECKDKGEQSMVILNRRGYFNYALCTKCTSPLRCPRCSVTTTLHNKGTREVCHYCGYSELLRKSCPECKSHSIIHRGVGTQNIEERLQNLIPSLRIARLDRDVLTSQSRLSKIISDFSAGETDCLVGTQMLAKGHDFHKVTLVVILHLEDALFLPDYRAAERTFQLLTQAMGRAGRGARQGKVVLQSLITGHPVIELSLSNNVTGFLDRELNIRRMAFHPPYSRQILFEIRHKNKEKAMEKGLKLKKKLVEYWQEKKFSAQHIQLAGPYFATLELLQNEYRVQLCISTVRALHPSVVVPPQILQANKNLRVDVDPYSFL